jgi:hypothetical protein
MNLEKDISAVVWIGCLLLLFLAVAVHEGWFSSHASPIITSGTQNKNNPSGLPYTIPDQDVPLSDWAEYWLGMGA